MRKFYLLLVVAFCIVYSKSSAQTTELFQSVDHLSKDHHAVAKKYQSLQIDAGKLSILRRQAPTSLSLKLPFENGHMKLQLNKVKITSDNFSVVEARADGSRHEVNYSGAVFYQGKIEGQSSSFATISIVNDQVIGVIADANSNIVLATIEQNGNATDEYVMYRESDLNIANPFKCFTSEIPVDGPLQPATQPEARLTAVGEPIDIYFECDFKFYQDKSSNSINVINYVLGFFNNTALLYANEDIKIQVSQILVWTTQDPEAAANLNTSGGCLNSFSSRMNATTYIGDYAHFLSTRSLGGGVAWLLNNPCSSSKFNRSAVSAINNTYNNFPTYSWTVGVVTHELGHNLGSNHTQWCGWVGGAIDNCYTTEGGCVPGPAPVNGGTIMSYCHLTSTGINFNNGFGLLPGNKIRTVVGGALCFGLCRMTVSIAKQDASCGQSNGAATVTAIDNTGALTYLWSNGQTGATLSNAAPGTYHVRVSDAGGCQVMEDVTIANSGTALTFLLSPTGTAGVCTGGNLLLNATNNPAYTYVWRKDGNIIGGATTASYSVNTAGTYSVTATSGVCSGTQSVAVSIVSTPTASITPNGPTTFCDGTNVLLNGNAGASYNYQWYNNGTIISGATSPTFSATISGNYTVKISAGASCEALSTPVAVTVNPSPTAVITTTAPTSFCSGGNLTLTASNGANYTHQWYRDGTLLTGATGSTHVVNTGGNYSVVTATGTCSRTSAPTAITVWANPVITITPANTTIQKFQTQTLTATGAAVYNWTSQPAVQNYDVSTAIVKPLTTTTYTIEGTDLNFCKSTASATINVIGCGDVTNVTSTNYSPSRVIIRWKNPEGSNSDTLQYRKVGASSWTKIFVIGEEYELNGLQPGVDYEYNIIPLCSTTTVYLPSPVKTFKTDALKGDLYIRLYPNPVSSTSTLEIITAGAATIQVAVFDNAGKRVMNLGAAENLPAGQSIRPLSGISLANGIYYVAVGVNGKTHNIKMVVMH